MTDDTARTVEFECDQCGYREWRPADREPWLCVVCGYMRWRVVKDDPRTDSPPGER